MDNTALRDAVNVLINDESIGDFVYTVRDRVIDTDPEYVGNSWHHPRVVRFSNAVAVLEQWLKEQS